MKKILIVPGLRAFIEEEQYILIRAEYRILTATSGEEVLRLHRAHKADLIIVDLDMHGIRGDKLCSLVKTDKDLSKASVILVCSDSKSDVKRCVKSQADFYITKPIDTDLLLKRVREILNIRNRQADRISLKVTVVGSAAKTFFCYAHDLSCSGMLIETDKILRKGESVGCLFCVSDSREIVVQGEVVRVKIKSADTYQYGIKFSHLSANAGVAIEALLNRKT